jgi:hypothetical protein
MKCNKTISIDSRILGRIEDLIESGEVLGISGFIENAVIHELEKYE